MACDAHALTEGRGVKGIFGWAAEYLKPAAEAGHVESIVQYARELEEGHHAPQDLRIYLRRVAEKRDPVAMFRYAVALRDGKGDSAVLGFTPSQDQDLWTSFPLRSESVDSESGISV
jgi:TPR repeat protein